MTICEVQKVLNAPDGKPRSGHDICNSCMSLQACVQVASGSRADTRLASAQLCNGRKTVVPGTL
jgi:hypothetical protein